MTLIALALSPSVALAVPAATSTSADIATSTCALPFLAASIPEDGATVGTDVQPVLHFGGQCGVWGSWELFDDDGASVAAGSLEVDTWLGIGGGLVTLPLPPLEPDTAYVLEVTPEGETTELHFTTHAGTDGQAGLPEGPRLVVDIEDVVRLPAGRSGPEMVDVFALVTAETFPGLLLELSDDEGSTDFAQVTTDDTVVVDMRTFTENGGAACFYGRVRDAFGGVSPWTEVCETVEASESDDDDDDGDDREPYTPKRCATSPAPAGVGLWALLAVLGLRRRR